MLELSGKYSTAKVFTDVVDREAAAQVIRLCNQPFALGSQIRLMPDIHAGDGCTVGTTLTITEQVPPSLVGSDIGCGMLTIKLNDKHLSLPALDHLIRERIPFGGQLRKTQHPLLERSRLEELYCRKAINISRCGRSLGTLGGGNHFIEVECDHAGFFYLIIHSGSRLVGRSVAAHYESMAELSGVLPSGTHPIPVLTGEALGQYFHDMEIAVHFAYLNRQAIAEEILSVFGAEVLKQFTTIHNYIDLDSKILRKGAVSAKTGEELLIPLNMRDGSLLCRGRGNEDWNCSAPHGAGRLMSRSQAKETLKLGEYRKQMEHVYSTSVGLSTLDESPMAYKRAPDIEDHISDTVGILEHLRPVYNFKAGQEEPVTAAGTAYEPDPAYFYSRTGPQVFNWNAVLRELEHRLLRRNIPMVMCDILRRMFLYVCGEMEIERFVKLQRTRAPLLEQRIALGERGEKYGQTYAAEMELIRSATRVCQEYYLQEEPSRADKEKLDKELLSAVQNYMEQPVKEKGGFLV